MKRPIICAIGVSHRDVDLARLWLRWVNFLSQKSTWGGRELLVVLTHRAAKQRAQLEAALQGSGFAWRMTVCPDEDEAGYPRSASHLFLRTLETAEKLYPGHAVCWCESDTVALRETWFTEISEAYDTCGRPFFGAKVGTQYPHLAGNSCYPHNWRELAPSIANVLNAPDYKLWGVGKGQPWDTFARNETTPQMAESKLWSHRWLERDVRATKLKDIPKEACIFHQDKQFALGREIAALRYPDFMATLNEARRFFLMNGHPSRLRAKGLNVRFSFTKWTVAGHRSAVCSDEMEDGQASALAALVGQLGVREVDEAEFLKTTGRTAKSLPAPKVREIAKPAAPVSSVFVMLGRYGDICNILPMLKAEADAGRKPTLVVSQDFADILDGVSYVDRIVWDGAYDRLPDALRWLRREKGIANPIVAQFHRNPYDKARMTPSYQTEVWRLAGKLPEFEARGPLVFDQRDEKRETALRWSIAKDWEDNAPVIGVALESASSPLGANKKDAIWGEIQRRFPKWHLVDLSEIRAEKIYDMLSVLEMCSVIVSVDTSIIHLSRALNRDLVAITNDGWRGSVAEHAKEIIRYADLTAEKLVDAVARVGLVPESESPKDTLTTAFYPRRGPSPDEFHKFATSDLPKVYHVADVFGDDDRHRSAQATWLTSGMVAAHVKGYPRNAKDELGDPRALPFLKDLLWSVIPEDATQAGQDIICWTNSDSTLLPGLVDQVREHVGKHGAASMRRTETNGQGHPGRDLFAFTVDWLAEHFDEMPDYVLGQQAFDLGLVAMIRKFHGLKTTLKNMSADLPPADMAPGLLVHEPHTPEWQVKNADSVPSVAHNKRLFREWAKKYAPEIKFSPGGSLK